MSIQSRTMKLMKYRVSSYVSIKYVMKCVMIFQAAAEACPDACLAIISNPVNSTVPIASEMFKKAGKYVYHFSDN